MTKAQIIEMVRQDCEAHGVALKLRPYRGVKTDSGIVAGYFCSTDKEVVVGLKTRPFIFVSNLIHEWNHMHQWLEAKRGARTKGARIWKAIDRAQEGSRRRVMREAQLELDAERRTVALLKKYRIGSRREIEAYIQTSALYVLSHHVMADTGTWFLNHIVINTEARRLRKFLPKTLEEYDFSAPPCPELYKAIRAMLR